MAISAKFEADFTDFKRGVSEGEAQLKRFTATTQSTSGSIDTFRIGLSHADRTLAAMGIHIGPEIRALEELSQAAGKTASQLGTVGTAGLALAAAVGGWQIGRLIADFFELDDAIGRVSAKLLGFGDVAAQEAGARMDVLAKATQIAGREITNFAEAQRIINEHFKEQADRLNTATGRVTAWKSEISKVWAEGNLQALRDDLASQNSTLKELSAQYGISTRALEYFTRETKAQSEAERELQAEYEKMAAILVSLYDTQQARSLELRRLNNAELERTSAIFLDLTNNAVLKELEAEQQLNEAYAVQETALERLNRQLDELHSSKVEGFSQSKQEKVLMDEYTKAITDEVLALERSQQEHKEAGDAAVAATNVAKQAYVDLTAQVYQFVGAIGVSADTFEGRMRASLAWLNQASAAGVPTSYIAPPGSFPGRAFGGSVSGGQPYMVGEKGPELFVPSASGRVVANAGGVVINVYGSVISTKEELARVVGDALMTRFKGRSPMPTGA